MHLYFHIFGLSIPGYGLSILTGIVLANLIAWLHARKRGLDFNDVIILEVYGIVGGFVGAKLLYLIVSFRDIEWSRFFEPEYFISLMKGGFVFYGGVILAILLVLLAGRLHKIDAVRYFRELVFLIPFAHGFGRIGCFMAGCCYGVPYVGFGSVVFPEGSYAPAGIGLFPVQLAEAAGLFLIAAFIFYMQTRRNWRFTVETYLFLYGVLRFTLEFFRYDDYRGRILFFSTSQWISLIMIAAAIVLFVAKRRKRPSA